MRLMKILSASAVIFILTCIMSGCDVASALGSKSSLDTNSKIAKSVPTKPSIVSTTLSPAIKDSQYSTQLVASGGTTPYVWKTSSVLPPGLTLTTAGVLQGTPTKAGNYSLTVAVFDSRENRGTKKVSLTVTAPGSVAPLIIATSSLPNATVGTGYSATISASGGILPYSWFSNGALPAGLSLSKSGVLSGTPTASGKFTVPIKVVDTETDAQAITANLPLMVADPSPAKNPAPAAGDFTIAASPSSHSMLKGGSATFTLALAPTNSFSGDVTFTTSALPAGMSVNYSGNPVKVSSSTDVSVALSTSAGTPAGTYSVTTTATSGSIHHTATYSVTVTANAQASSGSLCGVNSDNHTIYLPSNYGTMPMPGIGEANAVVDDFGCPVWKVADMSVHDAGMTLFDSQDRWIMTKLADIEPGNYWGYSGAIIRDIKTGATVCRPNIGGGRGWIWGLKPGDQDNLYFHVDGTSQIWKLNVPACISAGGVANAGGPAVSLWDDLKDPQTGTKLFPNLAWCQDASDITDDGDHLCVGYNNGGYLQDPRLYTISTKSVGPKLYGSPHQVALGCPPSPTKGACYRGAFVTPIHNYIYLGYEPFAGFQYADLFDGNTGAYIRTVTPYNGHGALAAFNGDDYMVDVVNGLDPQRPANCSPGIQSIRLIDGVRSCLLNLKGIGPAGTTGDYEESHINGHGTSSGNPYVAVDQIDYVYGITNFTTFAGLANLTSGTVAITDAQAPGDCTAGGGAAFAYCKWNSTTLSWDPGSTASYPLRPDWATHWGVHYNEILFVNLDGSVARHMVHHRSWSVENYFARKHGMANVSPYWSSPRVVVSRSGKYMAWDSTWGPNDNISVYISKIK